MTVDRKAGEVLGGPDGAAIWISAFTTSSFADQAQNVAVCPADAVASFRGPMPGLRPPSRYTGLPPLPTRLRT